MSRKSRGRKRRQREQSRKQRHDTKFVSKPHSNNSFKKKPSSYDIENIAIEIFGSKYATFPSKEDT